MGGKKQWYHIRTIITGDGVMTQSDLNGNKPQTIGKIESEKIVYNVEDHWEDLELEVKTNKIYDLTFKEYTERTISSKFTSEPRPNSFTITPEDAIIMEDVKQYAEHVKTNNKAFNYLIIYGLTIFQRENAEIIKVIRKLEPLVRHTTMINTFGMHNTKNNNCKLSKDSTDKFSVRMGDQLLSTISSVAYDLKVSSSTLFRALIYYAIKDSKGFLPEQSINYANEKLDIFEGYLLETAIYYKVSLLAQSIYDEVDRKDKDAVKEFLSRL